MNSEKPSRFSAILEAAGSGRSRSLRRNSCYRDVLFFVFRGGNNKVEYRTEAVTRGDMGAAVTATGR